MKRVEILNKLNFTVPESKKKRVIISSDVKNEADDHFAIMHHLLTPSEDVKGIIAAHFERNINSGKTMEQSYQEGKKILELAQIEDVPMLRGAAYELRDLDKLPGSEGADFIIEEALKDDERPLYIAVLGSITDVAIACLKKPEIAERMTAIWIGGAPYPHGGEEYNLMQDTIAANIVFQSPMQIWQIPYNAYRMIEVSLTELIDHVQPCGDIGAYLCEQMLDFNHKMGKSGGFFPHGESWCLGDNPTVSVLLQGAERECWEEVRAPFVNSDGTYGSGQIDKDIRVYNFIDSRLTLSDFFSKMKKCY